MQERGRPGLDVVFGATLRRVMSMPEASSADMTVADSNRSRPGGSSARRERSLDEDRGCAVDTPVVFAFPAERPKILPLSDAKRKARSEGAPSMNGGSVTAKSRRCSAASPTSDSDSGAAAGAATSGPSPSAASPRTVGGATPFFAAAVTPVLRRATAARRLANTLRRLAARFCSCCAGGGLKLPGVSVNSGAGLSGANGGKPDDSMLPHRWYRIHPEGNERYFVRPDAGRRGRLYGFKGPQLLDDEAEGLLPVQSRAKAATSSRRRWRSLPPQLEGRLGWTEPEGFDFDIFRNKCRICYERPTQVILLPCRHGALCEECLRRTIFSRPAHRGGRLCPLCRKRILEVVWIYGDAAIPQYGFTIKA